MSTLVTGEAVELSIRPAALAARALSCLIDWVIYMIADLALLIGTFWLLMEILAVNVLLLTSVMTIMGIAVFVGLPLLIETLTHGRSIGKLALGLRIVRDDGGAVRLRHSFIRALLWPFEILTAGGGIAALCGLLSPSTKRLGDYLAGTIAVSERAARPPIVSTYVAPQLVAWVRQADVMVLPGGLHRRVTQFLATAPHLTPDSRWQRAKELATEVNPYVAPAPPEGTMPEQFLSAVIHQRRLTDRQRMLARGQRAQAFRTGVDTVGHGLTLRP